MRHYIQIITYTYSRNRISTKIWLHRFSIRHSVALYQVQCTDIFDLFMKEKITKGAAHQNLCRIKLERKKKGAEHRDIPSSSCRLGSSRAQPLQYADVICFYSFAPNFFAVSIQCSARVSGLAPKLRARCKVSPIIKTDASCTSCMVCKLPNFS